MLKRISILILIFLMMIILSTSAFAYVDPSVTSFASQVVLLVIVIAVIVVIVLCLSRKHRTVNKGTGSTNKGNDSTASKSQRRGSFVFVMPLSERDSKFHSDASFDDQSVYYDWPYTGEQIIGHYKRRTDGKPGFVFLDKDGREIGFVDDDSPNYVFISRLAIYDNWLKQYGPNGKQIGEYFVKAKYPVPPFDLVGEISDSGNNGAIYDAKTNVLIGTYNGNKYGAACAFCALTSEIHSDTEYAKFLVNWEPSDFTRIE